MADDDDLEVISHKRVQRHLWRDFGRDAWMVVISAVLLIALFGFGPLGVRGIDDVARDAKQAALDAKEATRRNAEARADLEREVARNRLTRSEVARIAREQAKPSTRTIIELIRRATRVCQARPAECRSAPRVGTSSPQGSTGGAVNTPASNTPARRGRPAPPQRRKSGGGGGPPAPSGGANGGGGGGGGPAQSPPPLVNVSPPPLVPPVCVDNLVHVNCP